LRIRLSTLAAGEDELFNLIQDVVSSQVEKEQVTEWFLTHLEVSSP
jgi:hypothetical protein